LELPNGGRRGFANGVASQLAVVHGGGAFSESPMELAFTKEELEFRDEVRAFLDESVPVPLRRKLLEGRHIGKSDLVEWQRILNRKGWAVSHWPTEYGGTGWSAIKQYIFHEELQAFPAPLPLPFAVAMAGPAIFTFGTEKQKSRFLPRIANLDDWWCQGFSEPGAGSDLASLKTRATRVGGGYIINGQKVWTSLAHHADWMFCLCRTDPTATRKQSGISLFLIDMKSPGVTVRPIRTIDGGHEVNEIFLDDVEVPIDGLVGDENKGWDYAKFILGRERTNMARVGLSKERLRRVRYLASEMMEGGEPLIASKAFCTKLAAVEIELKALEITQMRVVASDGRYATEKPDPASSSLKIKGTEIQQRISELMLEAVGPLGAMYIADEDSVGNDHADWKTQIASNYFYYRKLSIYGGSNEIQRNVICKAVLGL
jgi:pimeloyl-CoA dehydrogenase large subunit